MMEYLRPVWMSFGALRLFADRHLTTHVRWFLAIRLRSSVNHALTVKSSLLGAWEGGSVVRAGAI